MNAFNEAFDELAKIDHDLEKDSIDNLSFDQRLKRAEVLALLSISQELSALRRQAGG